MKRILILKDVAYSAKIGGSTISGKNEVNLLADGAIAIFADDGTMLTAANAATVFATSPNKKSVYMAVGSGDATKGAKLTSYIDRMTADVIFKAYTAPVKQVQYIGEDTSNTAGTALNLPSPLVVGTTAIVRLTDTSAGTQPPIRTKTYEYMIKTGDTAAEILDGLVALNTADADRFAVLANVSSNGGLSVTAVDYGVTIGISVSGVLIDATIETNDDGDAVAINYGTGTAAQVAELEYECDPVEGNTNRVYQPSMWYSKGTDVVVSTTYDLYTINWEIVKKRTTGSVVSANPTLIIALPTAASTIPLSEIATIFVQAFGTARTNSETGS